ncbi:sigma-70 family RNA polymerase sigma factor [Methylobacterium sp. CM6257]
MGARRSPRSAAELEEGQPTLSDAIRQHLGRLLASTYERASTAPSALVRFADLLGKLEDTLDEAERRDAAEFQANLLAVVPALRRYALSLTHDRDAADDLVQDTLMRAWRGRSRFQIGTNFEGWTFTILRNRFYTAQSKLREFLDEDGAQAARLPALPEQNGRLDLADLQAALAQLSAPMREALILVTIEDLSYEEIAARMNCRVGTVKSRIWRARAQLARMLGYDGNEVGSDSVMLSAMEAPA